MASTASAHFFSKRWTCLFQKPAVIVRPGQWSVATLEGSATRSLSPKRGDRPAAKEQDPKSRSGASPGLG